MASAKQYGSPEFYEKKLSKVMERFEVENYDWDYNRTGGWVQFTYKGQVYRFEHSVENARAHNVPLNYGSDAFAQIVLALEDLARIVNRGIYDLQNWVAGMKALPTPTYIPDFFRVLGFDYIPADTAEVERAYRKKAAVVHPDKGGSTTDFIAVKSAYDAALKFLQAK